jgi:hypothetical protein
MQIKRSWETILPIVLTWSCKVSPSVALQTTACSLPGKIVGESLDILQYDFVLALQPGGESRSTKIKFKFEANTGKERSHSPPGLPLIVY